MSAASHHCSHSHSRGSVALYHWLVSHFRPTPAVFQATTVPSSCRSLTTVSIAPPSASTCPSSRSVHLSLSQPRRLPSYPLDEPTVPKRRRSPLPPSAAPPTLSPSELRTLSERSVREHRRRLAARHKELGFLSKAPLLAAALPQSIAHCAPALPRSDFQYAWPSSTFQRVAVHQPLTAQSSAQPAYESSRTVTLGSFERQLRMRRSEKNAAIDTLKQITNNNQRSQPLAADVDRQAYADCVDAVKLTRQLYSPLLSVKDCYTMCVATALCLHDRLLARLLEDAHIAGMQLPAELFARLLQLFAPLDSPAAQRGVVVVAHEYFTHAGGGRGEASSKRLKLSAEQYSRVFQSVSHTSSTHLLLPLLQAFRQSSTKARDVPQVCVAVLPALRYLSQQQQHDVLLSLSSAVLHWDVLGEAAEMWSGTHLSAVCELLQLHCSSLRSVPISTAQRTLPMVVPQSWQTHLPSQTELCELVPSLEQHVVVDNEQRLDQHAQHSCLDK